MLRRLRVPSILNGGTIDGSTVLGLRSWLTLPSLNDLNMLSSKSFAGTPRMRPIKIIGAAGVRSFGNVLLISQTPIFSQHSGGCGSVMYFA